VEVLGSAAPPMIILMIQKIIVIILIIHPWSMCGTANMFAIPDSK
jgi:hypothetical protein